MKVFVDTAAWIALLNTKDGLHQQSLQIFETLKRQRVFLVTSDFVLIEIADALAAPSIRSRTGSFIDGLRQMSVLQILPLSDELLRAGWELYRQRADKEWGLTDCISFAAMTQENLTVAFTSDHHFEQAGFSKLM